jgi:hypothetical protein
MNRFKADDLATPIQGYPMMRESAKVQHMQNVTLSNFIVRALLLALALVTTATAQEEPSRLRYALPDGWTPSIDGRTLMPPGGNAAVTFAPSTPFTGTAEQWIEDAWNSIARELKILSGPAPGTQGAFLTRIGLFQQADGTNVWLCLNTLVKEGRGESVILIAGGDDRFRALLPALSKMLAGTTVAASAPSVSTPPRGPAVSGPATAGGDDVAGLYLASTSQYRLNPLGTSGSGSWEWRTEFYLLSRDGRVFRGPDLPKAPDGDISRFDYDAARREAPAASGNYTVRGREVVLKMGPSQETIVATRPETGVLEIRGTKYKRGSANQPPK